LGDAAKNPNSPQYRGPLPAAKFAAGLEIRMQPNRKAVEKYELLPEEEKRNIRLSHAETDMVLMVRANWTAPLSTSDQWPSATFDLHELARVPLLKFKEMASLCFTEEGMPDYTKAFVDLVAEEPKQ
jgi:hypothetical protein